MSSPVFALAALRRKTLAAARTIPDYNFRTYFVQHTKDTFDTAVATKAADPAAMKLWIRSEGRPMLAQMRRMATIGAMYAKAPVFLDPALGGAATSGNAGAGSCFAAASAAAEASLPLPGTFAKVEVDPEEEQA
jgi:hypothetical protein